jgi:hypothetical protein
MNFQTPTTNRIHVITKPTELISEWDFFKVGLVELNKTSGGKTHMPEDMFLKILLDIIARGEDFGVVALMKSKNGANVGFFVVKDDTDRFFKPTAVVYATYSTGNNTNVTKDMVNLGEEWGRAHGYEQYYAICLRTGASIKRLFTKKWGFRHYGLLFRKDL